ncbi:hypothetical protein SAMN04488243_14711 [Thermus arciformis]|uniref:Uncharacterized protein n=1 Tax=Thermus arciformis TaxID=482827 RepID=A0A1G7KMK0_9DEIN|nr:hypothetical protein [Thermus arciformis]SDF37999.1 hypothetical protein SAMN04488243_14711 [Thermus arciformis]
MGRALALLFLLAPALGQTLSCDATEVHYNFSAPGPLQTVNVGGQDYYVANLAAYLALLSGTSPLRFLPTQVLGGTGSRVACQVTTPNGGGGGGTLCGAGATRCLRVSQVTGTLPVPGDWTGRLYVLGQVVSGNATSHVPTPTLLSTVPDGRGLFSVGRNTTAVLWIYFFLELSPEDLFPSLPASGTIAVTYRLQNN